MFWHLSPSLMISKQSGWQRILESKVPKWSFFKVTEHKAPSFSFQRSWAQLALKKKAACGLYSSDLECYLQCVLCHRDRSILNLSLSLWTVMSQQAILLREEAGPLCSIWVLQSLQSWTASSVGQLLPLNWHSFPPIPCSRAHPFHQHL